MIIGSLTKSAVMAEHQLETAYQILFDSISVVVEFWNYAQRKIRWAIKTNSTPTTTSTVGWVTLYCPRDISSQSETSDGALITLNSLVLSPPSTSDQ